MEVKRVGDVRATTDAQRSDFLAELVLNYRDILILLFALDSAEENVRHAGGRIGLSSKLPVQD